MVSVLSAVLAVHLADFHFSIVLLTGLPVRQTFPPKEGSVVVSPLEEKGVEYKVGTFS